MIKSFINSEHLYSFEDREFTYQPPATALSGPLSMRPEAGKAARGQYFWAVDIGVAADSAPAAQGSGSGTLYECDGSEWHVVPVCHLPLFGWVDKMLRLLPNKHTTDDGERLVHLLMAFRKLEPGAVVQFDEADYKWLMKVLWDDAEGRRYSDQFNGSWGMNVFGPHIGVAVKQQLEAKPKESPE